MLGFLDFGGFIDRAGLVVAAVTVMVMVIGSAVMKMPWQRPDRRLRRALERLEEDITAQIERPQDDIGGRIKQSVEELRLEIERLSARIDPGSEPLLSVGNRVGGIIRELEAKRGTGRRGGALENPSWEDWLVCLRELVKPLSPVPKTAEQCEPDATKLSEAPGISRPHFDAVEMRLKGDLQSGLRQGFAEQSDKFQSQIDVLTTKVETLARQVTGLEQDNQQLRADLLQLKDSRNARDDAVFVSSPPSEPPPMPPYMADWNRLAKEWNRLSGRTTTARTELQVNRITDLMVEAVATSQRTGSDKASLDNMLMVGSATSLFRAEAFADVYYSQDPDINQIRPLIRETATFVRDRMMSVGYALTVPTLLAPPAPSWKETESRPRIIDDRVKALVRNAFLQAPAADGERPKIVGDIQSIGYTLEGEMPRAPAVFLYDPLKW